MESNQTTPVITNLPVALTQEDLFRLDLAQERLKCLSLQVGHLQLEDKLDELSIHNIQLQQQVLSQDLQIRRKDRANEIKKVVAAQSDLGNQLEDLKRVLGGRYGIRDWGKVAYNDLTGEITDLSEPTTE